MRHERVDQLIQAIQDGLPEIHFDMRSWCNCIAGHAAILAVGRDAALDANHGGCFSEIPTIAREWLGISHVTGSKLFDPPEAAQCTDRNWAVRRLKSLKLEDA